MGTMFQGVGAVHEEGRNLECLRNSKKADLEGARGREWAEAYLVRCLDVFTTWWKSAGVFFATEWDWTHGLKSRL